MMIQAGEQTRRQGQTAKWIDKIREKSREILWAKIVKINSREIFFFDTSNYGSIIYNAVFGMDLWAAWLEQPPRAVVRYLL